MADAEREGRRKEWTDKAEDLNRGIVVIAMEEWDVCTCYSFTGV